MSSQLEEYKIEKLLGQGSFGSVYRARDKLSNTLVALKVVRANQMFTIENSLLQRLATPECHEYVICLLQSWRDAERGFLVFEFFDGYDLSEIVGNDSLTNDQIKTLAGHLLTGLSFIHNKGIAHRDIKLENILFNEGSLKLNIIDVGLACAENCKPRGSDTPPGYGRAGTPQYFPPEYFQIDRVITLEGYQKADIFALGVVLYELITGELFDENGPFTLQQKRRLLSGGRLEMPFNVKYRRIQDPLLQELVSFMIESDPSLRPTAAALLQTYY